MYFGAGETYVGHVAHALVRSLRRDEVWSGAVCSLPRLFQIEQGRAEGVYVAVARAEHAVIEQQPSLGSLYGYRTCADLHALPCGYFEGGRSHHVAVASPELHVGRFAIEDVTEGGVSGVARTGEHSEIAVDLLGEEYAVAVVGQESILQLVEGLEVLCPSDTDGGAVVAVAPGHVVAVFDEAYAGVIAVYPLSNFLVVAFEAERFLVDVPVYTVLRETYMEYHAAVGIIAAEHSGEAFAERYDGAVEDTVACGQQVAGNDGVFGTTPQR